MARGAEQGQGLRLVTTLAARRDFMPPDAVFGGGKRMKSCRLVSLGMLLVSLGVARVDAATVAAAKPESVVAALRALGQTADLAVDETGDPIINATISSWKSAVLFYDCDEATHDKCRSLQFSASFTPKQPFSAEDAVRFMKDHRFASVTVRPTGTVVLAWDVITASGIDSAVFAPAVGAFGSTMDALGAQVLSGTAAR
jgi:hypothetical protein